MAGDPGVQRHRDHYHRYASWLEASWHHKENSKPLFDISHQRYRHGVHHLANRDSTNKTFLPTSQKQGSSYLLLNLQHRILHQNPENLKIPTSLCLQFLFHLRKILWTSQKIHSLNRRHWKSFLLHSL